MPGTLELLVPSNRSAQYTFRGCLSQAFAKATSPHAIKPYQVTFLIASLGLFDTLQELI